MSIKDIFDEIANEPSTNKKIEILTKHKDGPNRKLLQLVLYFAMSKRVKFFIKIIPTYTSNPVSGYTLDEVINDLQMIRNREVTGNDAIALLTEILTDLTPEDAYIVERIIEKDCKIGMGSTIVNKVFKDLIEDTPYMGAKSFNEDLAKKVFGKNGKAISQIKMDGRYCNAIVRSGEVELESRQGEPTVLIGAKFLTDLAQFPDCVLNGELTMDGISRYESNGIVASLISINKKKADGEDVTKELKKFEEKHMPYQKAMDSIVYTVWDTITVDEYFDKASKTPYHQRLAQVGTLINDASATMVKMIDTRIVNSYEEAMAHFQELLVVGLEGTILKAYDGAWKDGKPNWQVKMKLEMDVDLKIIGFNYGTGKNANVISSVDVQSECGQLITSPAGINEEQMQFITDNQEKLLGTILEVTCSGLSKNKAGEHALLHPRFSKFRDDKNTCDTLESIREIEAMAKGLK